MMMMILMISTSIDQERTIGNFMMMTKIV